MRKHACVATLYVVISAVVVVGCTHAQQREARIRDTLANITKDHPGTPAERAEAALGEPPLNQMRGALRAISSAQFLFYNTHKTFTASTDTLLQMPACVVSDQVTVIVLAATATAWAAKSTHPALPGRSCVMWVSRPGAVVVPVTDHDHRRGDEIAGDVVCDSIP